MSTGGPFQSSETQYPIARGVGRFVSTGLNLSTFTGLRSSAGTTRLLRSTITAPTTATVYAIRGRVPGGPWTTLSVTTASTSDTAFRDLLIAGWNADPTLAGQATASAAASGVAVDWTGLVPGADPAFEIEIVTDPTTDIGAITVITAGAASFDATFGRYVDVTGANRTGDVSKNVVAELSVLAGPVTTATAVYEAAQTMTYSYIFSDPFGRTRPFADSAIAVGANLAASVAALLASFEVQFAGIGATFGSGTGVVTIAMPVGWSLVSAQVSMTTGGGAGDLTSATVAGGTAPAVVGLVYDAQDQSPNTIGGSVTGYAGDRSVPCLVSGAEIAVSDPGETVTFGSPVWIETAAGANKGRPYVSAAPSRFVHPSHVWRQLDTVSPALAVIGA